jgi:hypothetical protein
LWWGFFWSQTFEIYNNTMGSVAQSENVYLIDLARLMSKDTKYYSDPMHYTDFGAERVAQLLTMRLLPYLSRNFPSFNKGNCEIVSSNPGQ